MTFDSTEYDLTDTNRVWKNKIYDFRNTFGTAKNLEGLISLDGYVSHLSGDASWIRGCTDLIERLGSLDVGELKALIDNNNTILKMTITTFIGNSIFLSFKVKNKHSFNFIYNNGVFEEPHNLIKTIIYLINSSDPMTGLKRREIWGDVNTAEDIYYGRYKP